MSTLSECCSFQLIVLSVVVDPPIAFTNDRVAAIIGGIVGVITLIVIVVLVIWLLRRKRDAAISGKNARSDVGV